MKAKLVQDEPGLPKARLKLWDRMREAKLSMKGMAEALKIPRSTLYYWDTSGGPGDKDTLREVARILRANGVSCAGIWDREEAPMTDNVIQLHPPKKERYKKMEATSAVFLTGEDLGHFKLSGDPFEYILNPEDVWYPAALQRLEGQIIAGLKSKGIISLVGDPGAGKSTLLRKMYTSLTRETRIRMISPASLDRSKITSAALATAIIRDLVKTDTSGWGQEARSELLRRTLADLNNSGAHPILTLDEAHKLPDNALISLKQIWDSHVQLRMLSVLLIGQLPLKERLDSSVALREVTGRTAILTMPKLAQMAKGGSGAGARAYLQWRFARVGANADDVFAADSYKVLEARAVYPLFLNNLATRAMIMAAEASFPQVTAAHAARV